MVVRPNWNLKRSWTKILLRSANVVDPRALEGRMMGSVGMKWQDRLQTPTISAKKGKPRSLTESGKKRGRPAKLKSEEEKSGQKKKVHIVILHCISMVS